MRYPKPLRENDIIGVCAPSAGVAARDIPRLDGALDNLRNLGYRVLETASVRRGDGHVSADAPTRAAEFLSLYANPEVAAIIPPWGGEFLMDMLPLLDFESLAALPPKWVCGYSDITTLTFALTLRCDMATLHGSNLMNLGGKTIHPYDLALFEAMRATTLTQESAGYYGTFAHFDDLTAEPYAPITRDRWIPLWGERPAAFSGRILGGCLDVLCKLLGTPYAPVDTFLSKYGADGILWTLESCEMPPPDVYRTLWQMRRCGWFDGCSGILIGRADGCAPTRRGYALRDALLQGLEDLPAPVLYNADIGHIPPQIQLINGAMAEVRYAQGHASIVQRYLP